MAQKSEQKRLGKDTLEWIESHPELIGRLERLREFSEDPSSDLETLEPAERAVMEEINRLGGEALQVWMKRREAETSTEMSRQPGVRKHSKKTPDNDITGSLEITEQVFQRGSVTRRPLCERLKLRPGGYSRGLEAAVVDFGRGFL